MAPSVTALEAALQRVQDPELGRSLIELGMVRDLAVSDAGAVSLRVVLTTPACPMKARIGDDVRAALTVAGATAVEITWDAEVPRRAMRDDDPVPSASNIIFVMSGKGGVGKSTVATNLTMALHRFGCRVGLLDADIYGPSIPTMMGVMGRPISKDGARIEPLQRFGVKLMSIGFLLEDPKSAVIWRGPMLAGALMQFLKDVEWGPLDYLILDLPPGTGDIALTLSQRVAATGAVIVTTPQEVALQDVYKSVAMCKKVDIPVLGVIENMSYFEDPSGQRHELFGAGGGQAVAEFAEAPLLGRLPLDPRARQWGDAGTPVVKAAPELEVSKEMVRIAERLADRISLLHAARGAAEGGGELVIDRSGGQGRVRLPIAR
ncbi:MAG: Mrp/NBP35 family ATP-binding protein [Polyangiaceae bacterium]|nr:Mrp/NBP35 family ATP-binding protein [Polyangiaceae bacterium]